MTKHMTGTREEWLAARLELLEAEKELTRRSDELARRRQELPWVRVDKEYRFETDEGSASLADLFRGRSQLLVYHFMFGPDYTAGCPSCSAIADGFNGFVVHLANHDVMLWAVSRAPLAKLQAYKRRMGWTFPWASSFGGDFNFDFNVSFTEEQQREGGIEYNYRREPAFERAWTGRRRRGLSPQFAAMCRNRRGHVHAREAGHERVRARGRRRLPHLFHLCARTWTASGACTSGSTAPPRGATRRASGGAATTSTTSAERSRGCRGATAGLEISRRGLRASFLQFTAWKARHLACCREASGRGRTLSADAHTAWRLGLHCSHCCAGLMAILLVMGVIGPARDGCRGGGHHRRASRTGR